MSLLDLIDTSSPGESAMDAFLLAVARSHGPDPSPLLKEALTAFGAESVGLWKVDEAGSPREVLRVPESSRSFDPGSVLAAGAVTHRSVLVEDEHGVRLVLPLWTEGELDGLLMLSRPGDRPWSDLERAAAAALADRVCSMLNRDDVLRKRERQLAEAQAIAMIGSWEWEVSSNRIVWSDEQFRLHGRDPVDQVTYEWFFSHVHPDDREWFGEAMSRSLATGAAFEYPYRVVRPDGEVRWLYGRGEMVMTPDGRPWKMIGTSQDITAQKAAEEALRASEESYRTIFDSSNDAVFIHDLHSGAVLDANRKACELHGFTREELRSKGIELIGEGPPPFTTEAALEHISRAAAGIPQRFEWCTFHQVTGEEMWVEVSLQRVQIRGEDRILALVRDIRERKRAEAALVASEEAYRTIFKHSSEAIWVHDVSNGEMLDVNEAGCEMYGYTFDEMMEVGHDALLYPGSDYTGEKVAEYMARTLAGESPRFEWMGRRKDGSAVWGEVTLRKVTVGGKPRILASARDISERKAAEEALRRVNEELEQRVADRTAELAEANRALQEEIAERTSAEEALRASEEHFRRLIENASDLVMIVRADGAITYAGPSSERILGYPPDQLVGMGPPELVHPEDVDRVREAIADIAANPGKVRTDEFRVRHLDGSWRVLEMVGKTLSPDDAAEGFVANGRDVTERRRAEVALREATEAAERANRAKSEFLSRMSHELRTPMNSILGFAQVLETSPLEARQERCVQHILRAGRHLLQLINEVLQIAAIEAGRQNLSLEAVRVSMVLREAIELARPMAAQNRIDLEYVDGESADPYVRADRQRLTQVVLNLLSNAVKYNRSGGRVRVACEPARAADGNGRVQIRVEDTGHGIPQEKRAELFTPFARLGAENGDIEGTGLGLALSQRLTEAMGGTLRLERSGESGSMFAIDLAPAPSPLAEIEESQPVRAEAGIPEHRPASILYIEDNLANLSLVETILWERPNWRTIPALQGQIGVELAREHLPDVILLDLHLPDIRGEEVLRRLRAEPRTAQIPVVVISADATPAATERLLAAGAVAFLHKPIDVQEFLDTLDRLLPPNPAD